MWCTPPLPAIRSWSMYGAGLAAGIVRPHVAFLVPAHAHAAAAWAADVAGGKRDIHQRLVGAVVVVAPDQPLLVGEHSAPTGAALLWLGDPFGGLADVLGLQAGDLRGLFDAWYGSPSLRRRSRWCWR